MATTSTTTADLALRVREARAERQLTQEELAVKAGLTRDQVAAIELGRRDVSAREIYPLAQALDARVLDLLGVEDVEPERRPRYRNLNRGTDVESVETFARTFLRREESLRRVTGAGNS